MTYAICQECEINLIKEVRRIVFVFLVKSNLARAYFLCYMSFLIVELIYSLVCVRSVRSFCHEGTCIHERIKLTVRKEYYFFKNI